MIILSCNFNIKYQKMGCKFCDFRVYYREIKNGNNYNHRKE